ncbi:RagB/SusD family nutrient uptake outer membrane protein [Butyricimonas virosa]|uniref:RagB/SusD family nutrient uptake outer membrane protein n=3 Tax=Butyricimonas virosa TaxID=544645 RepID=A0A413IM00_9BACT|nr:RagB/SusD family nutrient uptake outer membrane protein [Butyricimonas virosa]MCI6412625.1 RagB/SusD family nutrient uptake outer membrane protein [Butyricimonas virosa]MDY5488582.1 RagB/SusD family nutrient uptake outer membrane protein [Butyricimonas virosa]RGL81395.1 RagB/SusD family nutrient uptake outer membrane protein [Butyricimonas virosa]RGY16390.1 RagB/SusD family nutrient uptake outer membrane protein [Butyricimonas virosa]RHI14457.1 RagB/SusD family nutrient uptake outer membran
MKKNIFLIVMILWGFCSCSDFLEPKSPSEYIPKTADALNEMLLGDAYARADNSYFIFSYHNILDDDVEMTNEPINYKMSIDGFAALYSWDPDMHEMGFSVDVWANYYRLILGANAALDYLDDVRGSVEEKAYVAAQAYALRAFYYFNLVNLFGEPYGYNKKALGVPLKLVSSLTDGFDKQNTVEEVYDQIICDLDEAEKNFLTLPEEKQYSQTYRINLPAVQLLRARVALHMNNREDAAKYAKKVIEGWNFSLYDLNSFKGTYNYPYPNFVSFDNPEMVWVMGNSDDVVDLLRKTFGYLDISTVTPTGKRNALNVSQDLLKCYKDNDLRVGYYFANDYDKKAIQGVYVPWGKMKVSYNSAPVKASEFGYALRLSEAYLILSEAVYDTDEELALKLINALREKRYITGTYEEVNYSGDELLNFIREERRRELCFEGQRWFDLRRYGMPSFKRQWTELGRYVGSYIMEKEDPAYTLPIPAKILDRNPALIQNKLAIRKTLQ